MTAVEILFRYGAPATDASAMALGSAGKVYGIRRLKFDRAARTLRVEYDATRLNAAAVENLVRQAGLEVVGELPLVSAEATQEQTPAA